MVPRSCYIVVLCIILSSNCHESNMTSGFDIRHEHHTVAKYVAVIFITIFLLYATVSNLLMTLTLFDRGNIYSRAFILISLQLIISNFADLLPDITIVLPEILQAKNISKAHQTTWVTHIFSFVKPFSIFAALHFTFLLTLNRFVMLILPKYNVFFESVRLYFLLGFVWLSVFAITTADFYYCITRYYIANLHWKRNCTKQSKESGDAFLKLRYGWMTFLPIAMFIMHITIFYSIQRKRRCPSIINQKQESSRMYGGTRALTTVCTGNYERDMLIQAALICGALESVILIFNFLSPLVLKIFGKKAIIPLGIFINCYVIFNHFLLPTIYFIYNKKARDSVKFLFLRFRLSIPIGRATTVTSINIPKA